MQMPRWEGLILLVWSIAPTMLYVILRIRSGRGHLWWLPVLLCFGWIGFTLAMAVDALIYKESGGRASAPRE